MSPLTVSGILILLLALVSLVVAGRLRTQSGLPGGRVLQSDMGGETQGKPLYSERYALAGTPDYLVETTQGIVPLEVKPTRTDSEPHQSHLLQVLAYCLLVEDTTGKRPPYGLLRYKSETFRVDYNSETRAHLLGVLGEMREAAKQREVHRSHEVVGRCRACGYREICAESLAAPGKQGQ